MCVLASAVDIFSSHPSEAVTGYPAGHRLASFYTSLQGMAECATCA